MKDELTKDSWLIRWGKMTDRTGYLILKATWLYADLDISPERREAIGYVDAYVEAFQRLYEGDYIKRDA